MVAGGATGEDQEKAFEGVVEVITATPGGPDIVMGDVNPEE